MADQIPLVISANKVREIPSGDVLDLTGCGLKVGADIVPDTTDTDDIGTSSLKFQDAHFNGTVNATTFSGAGTSLTGITSSNFGSTETVLIKNTAGTTLKTIRSPGS
jgi:hypothetical protein